jgi:undecaprenyl pyrophosphate synthase
MKVFYIPDGHRRYADRVGCTLSQAYQVGYEVLSREVIGPLLSRADIDDVDIFLLSSLNLQRRDSQDLRTLLVDGEEMLAMLVETFRPLARIRTHGTYLKRNWDIVSPAKKTLNLLIGTHSTDSVDCAQVDVFMRSGGEIRLSGAPTMLIGPYTQFYGIDALHPELTFADVARCLQHYAGRYMREAQPSGAARVEVGNLTAGACNES